MAVTVDAWGACFDIALAVVVAEAFHQVYRIGWRNGAADVAAAVMHQDAKE